MIILCYASVAMQGQSHRANYAHNMNVVRIFQSQSCGLVPLGCAFCLPAVRRKTWVGAAACACTRRSVLPAAKECAGAVVCACTRRCVLPAAKECAGAVVCLSTPSFPQRHPPRRRTNHKNTTNTYGSKSWQISSMPGTVVMLFGWCWHERLGS